MTTRFELTSQRQKVSRLPTEPPGRPALFKGAVYTVWIFICICMSLRVFLFAKKMKFLTKGGIHCISQVFPWHFYFMREHSLVELTEHDDSAANIIVHSTSICLPIMNGRRSGTREKSRKQALDSAWSMEMSRMMQNGTAEPVSRGQKFSGANGDKE